jgi:hypothetical protein
LGPSLPTHPKAGHFLGLNDVTQLPQPPDPPLYPKEEGDVLNTRLYYAESNLDNAFSVQIKNVGVCILDKGVVGGAERLCTMTANQ